MKEQYSYEKVAVTQIPTALNRIFSSLQMPEGQKEYSRSANRNLVMPLFGRDVLKDVDTLIDSLALVHPSRFFVVVVDEGTQDLTVEIGARCVGLSKSEHACSEVIRIFVPQKLLNAVPSVIRAHMLTGMTTELFLIDPRMTVEALNLMTPQTDTILFDSGDFDGRGDLLSKVLEVTPSIVDLQWLALSSWRDELRRVLDWARGEAGTPQLREMEIQAQSQDAKDEIPACAALFAGWFIERLSFRFSPSRGGKVVCRNPAGREITMYIQVKPAPGDSKLTGLVLKFEGGAELAMTRHERRLDTSIKQANGNIVTTARPIDDESRGGRLRRYFLIGESTTNYNSALRTGLKVRGNR